MSMRNTRIIVLVLAVFVLCAGFSRRMREDRRMDDSGGVSIPKNNQFLVSEDFTDSYWTEAGQEDYYRTMFGPFENSMAHLYYQYGGDGLVLRGESFGTGGWDPIIVWGEHQVISWWVNTTDASATQTRFYGRTYSESQAAWVSVYCAWSVNSETGYIAASTQNIPGNSWTECTQLDAPYDDWFRIDCYIDGSGMLGDDAERYEFVMDANNGYGWLSIGAVQFDAGATAFRGYKRSGNPAADVPSSTDNLLLLSDDYWQQLPPWGGNQSLFTSVEFYQPDPFGGAGGTKFNSNGSNDFHQIFQEGWVTNAQDGDDVVASCYVKWVSGTPRVGLYIYCQDRLPSNQRQNRIDFNSSGVPSWLDNQVYNTFEDVGNGWYRLTLAWDLNPNNRVRFKIVPFAGSTDATESVIFAGAQLQYSDTATEYQKTPEPPSEFYAGGLGGGGWLESAIMSGDTWLLGSDTSGIYRSADAGASWDLWNVGLGTDVESYSRFIGDISIYDGKFLAATLGGIFTMPIDGAEWTCETPPEDGYKWEIEYTWGNMEDAIPFSVVASDGGYRLAGAGNNRFDWDSRRSELYPLNVYSSETFGIHSLWESEDDGPWVPVESFTTATGTPQHVLDIVIQPIGGGRAIPGTHAVVVSTRTDCWLKYGTEDWTSINEAGITMPSGGAWWTLKATNEGYLYGALLHTSSAATDESAVYVMDLTEETRTWELVNNGSIIPALSYGNGTGTGQMMWVSVWPGGANPDTLLAAYRSGGNMVTLKSICEPSNPSAATWTYSMDNGDEFGWNDIWGNSQIIDMSVRTGGDVLAQPNSIAVKSRDYGSNWESVTQTEEASGWWTTTGYRQLCVFDIAYTENGIGVIPAGSLIYSTADIGIVYTNGSNWSQYRLLDVPFVKPVDTSDPKDGHPENSTVDVAYDRGSGHIEVIDDWLGYGMDALVFISGEGHWGPMKSDCRLMIYGDEDDDATAEYRTISSALAADYIYAVTAFVVEDDTHIAFSSALHNMMPSLGPAVTEGATFSYIQSQIHNATFDTGTDTWSVGSANTLASPPHYATDMIRMPGSGRIFLAGADQATIDGGVWYKDALSTTWARTTTANIGTDVTCFAVSSGGEWLYAGTQGGESASVGGVYVSKNAQGTPTWTRLTNDTTADFGITNPTKLGGDKYDGTDLDAAGNITDIRGLAVLPSDSTRVYIGMDGSIQPLADWCGVWTLVDGDIPARVVGAEQISVRAIGIYDNKLVAGYVCADVGWIDIKDITVEYP